MNKRTLTVAIGSLLGIATLVVIARIIPSSDWTVDSRTDPINDKASSSASLTSTDGLARIEISCSAGDRLPLALTIGTQSRMGGFKEDENYVQRMVRFRFDSQKADSTVGILGDSFIGFGLNPTKPNVRWDAPILFGMTNAQTLAVETESVVAGKVQYVFGIGGADRAIASVSQTCAN